MRNWRLIKPSIFLSLLLQISSAALAQNGGFDRNQYHAVKTYVSELHKGVMANIPCESRDCARFERDIKRKFKKRVIDPMHELSTTAQLMTKHNSNFKVDTPRFINNMYPVLGQYQQIVDHLCSVYGDEQLDYSTACIQKRNFDLLIPFLLEPHYKNFITDFEKKNSLTSEGDIVEIVWREYVTRWHQGLRNVPVPDNFRGAAAPLVEKHEAKLAALNAQRTARAQAKVDAKDRAAEMAARKDARAKRDAEILFAMCQVKIDGQLLALRPDTGSGDAEIVLHLAPNHIREEGLSPGKWSEYALHAASERFDSTRPRIPKFSKIEIAIARPRIPPRTPGFKFMGEDVQNFYVAIRRDDGEDTKQIVKMENDPNTTRKMVFERGKGVFISGDGQVGYEAPPAELFYWLTPGSSREAVTLTLSTKIRQTFSSTNRYGNISTDSYDLEPAVAFDYRMPVALTPDRIAAEFDRLRTARAAGECKPKFAY